MKTEPKPIIMGQSKAGRMMEEPRGSDHRGAPEPQQDQGQQQEQQGEQNSKAANTGDGGQVSQDAAGAAGSSQNQGQGENPNQKQSQKDNRDDQDEKRGEDGQKKRCDKCGKKLGLTGGFPCRCGGTYCAVHRYSDRHECSFDYRELGASEIRRDNPLVVASKLRKL